MEHTPIPSSRNKWLTIGLASALVLAICFVAFAIWHSRQSQPPAQAALTETAPPTQSQAPSAPKYNCPLTGAAVDSRETTRTRPVVVQIDNAPAARPQAGLSQADIVYEAMAEGEITRYSAVFGCQSPDSVGPVRSARLIDLELVPEYQALLADSGSSTGTTRALEAAEREVPNMNNDNAPGAYQRTSDRAAPHNLMVSIGDLLQAASDLGFASTVDLDNPPAFKQDTPAAPGAALKTISVPYSQYADVSYRYDAPNNAWQRLISGEAQVDPANGAQIEPKNVIIQYVQVSQSDIKEDANNYGLEFTLKGSGKILVFRDGQLISGKWQRTADTQITSYLDAQGHTIPLDSGQTWIEVVPTDFQASWG